MTQKTTPLFLTIALALIAFIPGVSNAAPETKQQAVIKLGAVGPLSGDFASYGNFIRDGIRLAITRSGRNDVEFYMEDACLPAKAVTAAQQLTTVREIDALVGSYCVIGMMPMAPLFERNKIVSFHTSPVTQQLLDAGNYLFSTNIRIADEAARIAGYALEELKATKAAIMYFEGQWGIAYRDGFQKVFEAGGGTVVSSTINPLGDLDFRSILTKVRGKRPDVLFVPEIASAAGSIMKQAKELGITATILTVDEAEDESVLQAAGDAAEGMLYFSPEPKNPSEAIQETRALFKEQFGYPMHTLSANAYDATNLALQAIDHCGDNPPCQKDYVLKISNYPGMSGTISFDTDGGTTKEYVLKTVRGGKFVRVP